MWEWVNSNQASPSGKLSTGSSADAGAVIDANVEKAKIMEIIQANTDLRSMQVLKCRMS
jgi:hypothetical protein